MRLANVLAYRATGLTVGWLMLEAPGGGGGFAGITEAVDTLVAASQSGGFSLSENGGQPLLNAIHELQVEVATALRRSSDMERQLPLGATPNATVYKPFIATVASDPTQGSIPVLKKLQTDLENAYKAIQKSISNLQETDQSSGANIGSAGQLD